jgi:hypothetical protein
MVNPGLKGNVLNSSRMQGRRKEAVQIYYLLIKIDWKLKANIQTLPASTLSWLVDAKYTILQNQRSFFHQLVVETVFSNQISIKTQRFEATTTLLSILGIIDDLRQLCHD